MNVYDLIIVGGGAAGLMAGYRGATRGLKVAILEKNEKLGKKLYITGKGRCNITNDRDISQFIEETTRNGHFMYSSFYTFTNVDLISMLEDQGLKTKVERGGRIFPQSDKSSDVIRALEKSVENTDVYLNTEVVSIEKDGLFYTKTDDRVFTSHNVLIATGGITYPGTGSTGDGYDFARSFGHRIIEPKGTLIPIELNLKGLKDVAGITVKNSEISLYIDGKKETDYFGDFLFTHSGISGPIVLTLSDRLVDLDPKDVKLLVDFKPGVKEEQLENRLLKDIQSSPKRHIKNLMPEYFPKSLGEFILETLEIDLDTNLHQIDRKTRRKLIDGMKRLDLKYKRTGPDKLGVVTKGGVDTLEIDPSTNRSKLVEGLYFAGEVLDVSGLTGGYNLQIAFSTGYLVGDSIKEKR